MPITDETVAGIKGSEKKCLTTFVADNMSDARTTISDILTGYSLPVEDSSEDDFNRVSPGLNEKVCPKCLIKAVFDNGKLLELNKEFCPEIVTGIGRTGGMSVAAIIFDGGEKGVELTVAGVSKLKSFTEFAVRNGLPLVTFVNTLGIKADLETSNSTIMKDVYALAELLRSANRLSVLFAAKSLGVDYSYAFANAEIGLFDGAATAAAFGEVREDKLAEFEKRYSDENADPINAAKNGYIDNIIEPQFVRAYVISALQTIVR